MFSTLVRKELQFLLQSPKYVATFGVTSLLILLSVFVGIQDYRVVSREYHETERIREDDMKRATSWFQVQNRAVRPPDPLQVFVTGVQNDVGRSSPVSSWTGIDLDNSVYMEDTLFAVFRFVDFAFVVQVILALFAILFTYDAVSGERERGTLQLTLSNPVPRTHFLLAKLLGSAAGLILPLLVPIGLSALLILAYGIPFRPGHWVRLLVIVGYSFVYVGFFLTLGVLVSTLTRRSSVSFLVLLTTWIFFVLIIPRVGVMAAGQIVQTPSVTEIESKKEAYARTQREEMMRQNRTIMDAHMRHMDSLPESERERYRDDNEWNWMQELDKLQKKSSEAIAENNRRIDEDVRNRRERHQALALQLARLSPATLYQLAVLRLSGNDVTLKTRYEQAMQDYRDQFTDFLEKKGQSHGGFVIRIGPGHRPAESARTSLDLSEMPRFTPPEMTLREALNPTLFDVSLLLLLTGLCLGASFVVFLRYDVRGG